MFPEGIDVKAGMTVRHDEGGLLYEVEDVRHSTIGYEQTHKLAGNIVNYVQLEDGGMPAGTQYGKDETGFRAAFTPEN